MTDTLNGTDQPSKAMLDHPGWLHSADGRVRRAFSRDKSVWTVVHEPTGDTVVAESHSRSARSRVDVPPTADLFDPAVLPTVLRDSHAVREVGRVRRFRNPDPWDALLPPLLQHRTRAVDAARMYRSLCAAHGRTVPTEAGAAFLPPEPDVVADLPDSAFAGTSLRSKGPRLRAVASVYLARATKWATLSPGELYGELLAIPHVGKWTAGVVTADVTNDFSYYSFWGTVADVRWRDLFAAVGSDLSASQFRSTEVQLDRRQLSTLVLLALMATRTARQKGDSR